MCHNPWSHHHSGWPYCVCEFRKKIHNSNGIDTYTNSIVPIIFKAKEPISNLWTGFLHITCHEWDYLKNFYETEPCQRSMEKCKGIFFLSKYVCNFFKNATNCNVLCDSVKMAISPPKFNFDFDLYQRDKKICTIGHWLRRIESIQKIKTHSIKKYILNCTNQEFNFNNVESIKYLEENKYEELLRSSIVFLDLKDASVNNTVLECIARSTPLIVNRHPAVEEYLGIDYPLFYESLDQVEELSKDINVLKAIDYLNNMDKSFLSIDRMIDSITNSKVYKTI